MSNKPGMFECPSNENTREEFSSYCYRGVSAENSWLAPTCTRNMYGQDKTSDPGRKALIIDGWVWDVPLHDNVYNIWFSDGSAEPLLDELNEIRAFSEPYRRWIVWNDIIEDLAK